MKPLRSQLILAFPTVYGRFVIRPVENETNLYSLQLEESQQETTEFGRYRALNDAILAVTNQETGCKKWDGLYLEHVPYKVYDITCWEFDNFSGTNEARICS